MGFHPLRASIKIIPTCSGKKNNYQQKNTQASFPRTRQQTQPLPSLGAPSTRTSPRQSRAQLTYRLPYRTHKSYSPALGTRSCRRRDSLSEKTCLRYSISARKGTTTTRLLYSRGGVSSKRPFSLTVKGSPAQTRITHASTDQRCRALRI